MTGNAMALAASIRTAIKDVALATGVYDQLFFKIYPYMFEPEQLARLMEFVKIAAMADGAFVEAGCAHGATTVFLNKFMTGEGIDHPYFAIDTFAGFVPDHARHEIEARGKDAKLAGYFTENKQAWFDKSMSLHGITRVKSIRADVAGFDFGKLAPIAFCLLDVDLYLPIKAALPNIYAAMAPGGIVLVDDCKADDIWDGALQAYEEFIAEKGLPRDIVAKKLGVVRKT